MVIWSLFYHAVWFGFNFPQNLIVGVEVSAHETDMQPEILNSLFEILWILVCVGQEVLAVEIVTSTQ